MFGHCQHIQILGTSDSQAILHVSEDVLHQRMQLFETSSFYKAVLHVSEGVWYHACKILRHQILTNRTQLHQALCCIRACNLLRPMVLIELSCTLQEVVSAKCKLLDHIFLQH